MPELPTCSCVRGLAPYDRLTAIYQAAAELSGDTSLPDALCVAGVPPFDRFSFIYEAFRVLAGDDTLPSQECIEGESFQDQVSRIYQAVLAYADDGSLPSYLCVRGLPIWQQWVSIYNALYVSAGSPEELVNPLCVAPTFDVLSEVFCALTSGCTTPTLVSATIVGDALTLIFSHSVTGHTGFTLEIEGGNAPITYGSGDGSNTLHFTSIPAAADGDEVLVTYAPGNVTSGDCPLLAFSDFVVTNNTPPPEGFNADMLFRFESGTAGDPINAVYLNANQITASPWSWIENRSPQQAIVGGVNMPLTTPITINGTTYDGSGTRSLRLNLGAGTPFDLFTGTPPGSNTEAVASGVFKFVPGSAVAVACDYFNLATGSYATFQHVFPGNYVSSGGEIHLETQVGGLTNKSTPIPVDANVEYQWSLRSSSSTNTGELVIMDGAGLIVGTSARSQSDILGPIAYMWMGSYLSFSGGGDTYFDNVSVSFGANAVVPRFSFVMPDPTSVVAEQVLSGVVALTFNTRCTWFKIERSVNGGAFSVLEAQIYYWQLPNNFLRQAQYLDSAVSNGTMVQYRVTNGIGTTHLSNAMTSNSVLIDNAAVPIAYDKFVYDNSTFLGQAATTSQPFWYSTQDGVTVNRSSLFTYGHVRGGGSSHACATSKATFNANHRSVARCKSLNAGSFEFGAVTCRGQSGAATFYMLQTDGTNWFLFDYINGTGPHVFASGTSAIGNGDYIEIKATGVGAATRVTASKIVAGITTALATNADPGIAHYIDNGAPGIGGQGATPSFGLMDDWKGYNV